MNKKKYTGKLIAVDMYNCDIDTMSDAKTAEEIVNAGCIEFGLQCRELVCCQEDGQQEYSISAVCHHGHATIHVYPEIGFMTVDVFSCCEGADPAGMARYLRSKFDADKCKITILDRGDFGSENDMKPSRRSQIKFIRRTKNATSNMGKKIKKIFTKPRSI